MIKCSLASAVSGRFLSVLAPSCRSQVIRSWMCVFVLCVAGTFVNETVSSSCSCFCRMDVLDSSWFMFQMRPRSCKL